MKSTDAGDRRPVPLDRFGYHSDTMSDDWRPDGRRGPDGFGDDLPSSSSSSSRSVPIYLLFLIMLGSGIFTLVFLWICVQCIYHRRRVRRARADIERNAAAQQAWEAAGGAPDATAAAAKDVQSDVKRCDAGDEELTYVVMAGEEQPTFLARPLKTSQNEEQSSLSSSSSKHAEDDDALLPANPDKTSAS